MKLPRPKYKDPKLNRSFEILTLEEYKKKIKCPLIPNTTLHYQISQGNLDFMVIGRFHHIVYNDKAKKYRPGENYGKRWKNKEK